MLTFPGNAGLGMFMDAVGDLLFIGADILGRVLVPLGDLHLVVLLAVAAILFTGGIVISNQIE